MKVLSITHTDLDGVASSAIVLRALEPESYRVVFTEPDSLHLTLRALSSEGNKYDTVSISDLGLNSSTVDEAFSIISGSFSRSSRVIWIDHHIWNREWEETAVASGVELMHDISTCAAGIASRLRPGDAYLEELSKIVCSADEWKFDDSRAPWLVRYVGFSRDQRWLQEAHRSILESRSIEELVEKSRARSIEVFDKELRYSSEFLKKAVVVEKRGVKVAFGIKEEPEVSASLLAQLMLGRLGADIAAILNESNRLEFRSNKCNVREIAFRLGGGGHPKASGSPAPSGAGSSPVPSGEDKIKIVLRRILEAVEQVGCIPV